MNSLRRQIIKTLSITGLGLGFSQPLLARRGMGNGISSLIFANTTTSTTVVPETLVSNTQVLKIPSLDRGEMIQGKRVFNLNVAKASSEFFAGVSTETVGINQAFLGTTLRARRDETVQLNITNQLDEITTMH
jgi:FtsP/CotA-like multicopper oxidase with cupredoxin domain